MCCVSCWYSPSQYAVILWVLISSLQGDVHVHGVVCSTVQGARNDSFNVMQNCPSASCINMDLFWFLEASGCVCASETIHQFSKYGSTGVTPFTDSRTHCLPSHQFIMHEDDKESHLLQVRLSRAWLSRVHDLRSGRQRFCSATLQPLYCSTSQSGVFCLCSQIILPECKHCHSHSLHMCIADALKNGDEPEVSCKG